LGPCRNINRKYVSNRTGVGWKTLEITERFNIQNFTYIPDNLWFGENFLKILKNTLVSKENIFIYNTIKYLLIDSNIDRVDLPCGCGYQSYTVKNSQNFLLIFPSGTSGMFHAHPNGICSCNLGSVMITASVADLSLNTCPDDY